MRGKEPGGCQEGWTYTVVRMCGVGREIVASGQRKGL